MMVGKRLWSEEPKLGFFSRNGWELSFFIALILIEPQFILVH